LLKDKFSLPTQLSIFFQVQSKFIALAVPSLPNIYWWTSNNLNINHWCFWEEGIFYCPLHNMYFIVWIWIQDGHLKSNMARMFLVWPSTNIFYVDQKFKMAITAGKDLSHSNGKILKIPSSQKHQWLIFRLFDVHQ
jgi:hypothetical protein